MMHRDKQPRKTASAAPPKNAWRVIEGDAQRVLKTIEGILEKSGDDTFEVEFRIHRSVRAKPGTRRPVSSTRAKRAGPKRTTARRPARRR